MARSSHDSPDREVNARSIEKIMAAMLKTKADGRLGSIEKLLNGPLDLRNTEASIWTRISIFVGIKNQDREIG